MISNTIEGTTAAAVEKTLCVVVSTAGDSAKVKTTEVIGAAITGAVGVRSSELCLNNTIKC